MKKKLKINKKELVYIIPAVLVLLGLCIGGIIVFFNNPKVQPPKKEKQVLKIDHKEEMDISNTKYLKHVDIDCSFDGVKDTEGKYIKVNAKVDNSIKKIIDVIEKKLKIELDASWKYYAFVDPAGNYTVVNFKYYISDEIETDKYITIDSTNKGPKKMHYVFLRENEDEDEIKKNYKEFNDNIIQERAQLEKNDEYALAETKYIYYYSTNKLVYKYTDYVYRNSEEKIITYETTYIVK